MKTPPGLPDDTDAMVAGLGDEKDAEEQADQLCIEDELDGLVAVAGHLRQFQGQRADHESSESADRKPRQRDAPHRSFRRRQRRQERRSHRAREQTERAMGEQLLLRHERELALAVDGRAADGEAGQ